MTHIIFKNLSEFVPDEDWKSILLDMSDGLMPEGFVYNTISQRLYYEDISNIPITACSASQAQKVISFINSNFGSKANKSRLELNRRNIPYYIADYCKRNSLPSHTIDIIIWRFKQGILKLDDFDTNGSIIESIRGIEHLITDRSRTMSRS